MFVIYVYWEIFRICLLDAVLFHLVLSGAADQSFMIVVLPEATDVVAHQDQPSKASEVPGHDSCTHAAFSMTHWQLPITTMASRPIP